MSAEFATIMRRWAGFGEGALTQSWTWRGRALNVREALYRTLEEEKDALVRCRQRAVPEARLILSLAVCAFAELGGLVCGLRDELVDMAPAPGEWPLRQVVKHITVIEQRYAAQTRYASSRGDFEPLRLPNARLVAADRVDDTGTIDDLQGRLAEAGRPSDESCQRSPHSEPPGSGKQSSWALSAGTRWAGRRTGPGTR